MWGGGCQGEGQQRQKLHISLSLSIHICIWILYNIHYNIYIYIYAYCIYIYTTIRVYVYIYIYIHMHVHYVYMYMFVVIAIAIGSKGIQICPHGTNNRWHMITEHVNSHLLHIDEYVWGKFTLVVQNPVPTKCGSLINEIMFVSTHLYNRVAIVYASTYMFCPCVPNQY